jgi:hypothetical protein
MGLKHFIGRITFTVLLGIPFAHAQNKQVIVHGRIYDKGHNAIPYAAVQNINTSDGINSNARGFYILKTTLPASLQAFALGYNIEKTQIAQSDKDSVEMDFELSESPAQLQAVTIKASYAPQLIEEKPNLMDFELKNGKLWLVYSIKGSDRIEIVDTGGKHITQSEKLSFHKDSINQTPHGFLYTTHKDSLQLYTLDSNKIKITSMLLETYKKYSGSLAGFRYPYYYYLNYSNEDSHIEYSCFDKSTNSNKVFYKYTDSRLFRANWESQQSLLLLQALVGEETNGEDWRSNINNRNDTLISALGYQPDDQTIRQLVADLNASKGTNVGQAELALMDAKNLLSAGSPDPYTIANEQNVLTMLHGKVFSVLRVINDSVYIFNFHNNMITVYSPTNEYVRQEPFGINIHAIRFRKKEILVDETTHECYFKYKNLFNRTFLEKIDLASGNVSYRTELIYPFIDKVRLSGGYAYFSYFNTQDRDNIYNGQTCLYKQKLD